MISKLWKKIELPKEEFYDFGEATRHAGPIDEGTIKEFHRLERILEIEKILEETEDG